MTLESTIGAAVLTQKFALIGDRFSNEGRFLQALGKGTDTELAYVADTAWAIRGPLVAKAHLYLQQQRQHFELHDYSFASAGLNVVTQPNTIIVGGETGVRSGRCQSRVAAAVWRNGRRGRAALAAGADRANGDVALVVVGLDARGITSHRVRGGANLAHQFPDLDQLTGTFGDPAARAERARSVEGGAELFVSSPVRAQVTVYDRRERDGLRFEGREYRLIDGVVEGPALTASWQNALSTTSRGVELVLQRRATSGFSGWLGYAYGRARVTHRHRRRRTGRTSTSGIRSICTGQSRSSPRTSYSAKFRYGSNFPVVGYYDERPDGYFVSATRNDTRLPRYARLDLRANHSFNYTHKRLTLFCRVLNVLGRANYRTHDPSIRRSTGQAFDPTQTFLPFVPSVGFIIDF